MKTFVIAEMGSCHDGSLDQAKELVQIAADAGASAVKAQFWSSAARLAERRHAPEYARIYARYQLPVEWLPVLAEEAAACKIEFMCTAYLPEDIPVVAPHVSRFKIASFEALDLNFIEAHVGYGKEIIVSTGMQDHRELLQFQCDVIDIEPDIRLLHCVSGYPTPIEEVNLSVISAYSLDGFSDHTGHAQMGAWAVLAGATVVEVHFKARETSQDNPDAGRHAHSPTQLHEYVWNIADAEMVLGESRKGCQYAEQGMARYRVRA